MADFLRFSPTGIPAEMSNDHYIGPAMWIRIRKRFGTRMMEWYSGAVTAAFGIVLLRGDDLFSQPAWTSFAKFFESQAWFGWLMVILGAIRIGGLIVNGTRKHVTPQIRQVTAFMGVIIWTAVSLGFASSGILSTWAAVYPLLVVAEMTNILRAATDQGEAMYGRSD